MSGETRETTLAEQILQESEKKVESRRERRARLEAEAAQHTVEDGETSGGTKKYHLVSQHSDETADAPADDDEPEAEAADHTKQFKTASAAEYDDGEDFAEAKPRKKKLRKADYVEIDDALDDDDLDNLEYIASSKKRRKKLDEEAEEEADYDDYDKYEDDDVRRSSRRSSYEDYDGDSYEGDDSPGAMHYVLGAIKTLVAIALILVILVFILYFANQALDGGVPAYKWLSEKVPVLNRFLPVDEPEEAAPVTEVETIEAIDETEKEETPAEGETPAEEEAPTEEEAPAEGEEPVEEEAPAPVG